MRRICKRCGAKLSRFAVARICDRCRRGDGRLYENFDAGTRSPEVPSAIESNRDRH